MINSEMICLWKMVYTHCFEQYFIKWTDINRIFLYWNNINKFIIGSFYSIYTPTVLYIYYQNVQFNTTKQSFNFKLPGNDVFICGGNFEFFITAVRLIWSERASNPWALHNALIGNNNCFADNVLGATDSTWDCRRPSKYWSNIRHAEQTDPSWLLHTVKHQKFYINIYKLNFRSEKD